MKVRAGTKLYLAQPMHSDTSQRDSESPSITGLSLGWFLEESRDDPKSHRTCLN